MIKLILASAAFLTASMANVAQAPEQQASGQSAANPDIVCKYVVAAGRARDNKPYQLCQGKAAWAAKEAADAKDATRMVCHYQDIAGSRLKAGKQCQTADKWAEDQLEAQQHVQEIQARTCQGQGPC